MEALNTNVLNAQIIWRPLKIFNVYVISHAIFICIRVAAWRIALMDGSRMTFPIHVLILLQLIVLLLIVLEVSNIQPLMVLVWQIVPEDMLFILKWDAVVIALLILCINTMEVLIRAKQHAHLVISLITIQDLVLQNAHLRIII